MLIGTTEGSYSLAFEGLPQMKIMYFKDLLPVVFPLPKYAWTNESKFIIQQNMWLRQRSARKDYYSAMKWLLLITLFGVATYELIRIRRQKKFATLELDNELFSDQLYEVCAGLVLAEAIGREFHPFQMNRRPKAEHNLRRIAEWFPSLASTMRTISDDTAKVFLPYTPLTQKRLEEIRKDERTCLWFDDPYTHDMELFQRYEAEIRRQLHFSEVFQNAALQALTRLNIHDRHFAVCVHIGKRVPFWHETDHSMHDIVKAARNVAIKTNLTAFYIFADKIEFAKAMAAILRINEKWQPNVHISTFTQLTNIYAAAQLCGAVLLTEGESTLGFWIGFFATKQDAVYFMQSKESDNRRRLFLPKWQPCMDELAERKRIV